MNMLKIWIDTETSGLDEHKHGIVTLALLVEKEDEIIDEAYFEMLPTGRQADPKALEVNKLTMEEIKTYRPWEQVKLDVDAFLQTHVDKWDKTQKYILAGQNAKDFDLKFLKSYYEACGDNYLFSYIKAGPYIDTLSLMTVLQDLGKAPILENYKLETLCNYFGVELTDSHNALADIKATREVYLKMKELLNEK